MSESVEIPIEVSGAEETTSKLSEIAESAKHTARQMKEALAGTVIAESLTRLSNAFEGTAKVAVGAAGEMARAFFMDGPVGLAVSAIGILVEQGVETWKAYQEQAELGAKATAEVIGETGKRIAEYTKQLDSTRDTIAALQFAARDHVSIEEAMGIVSRQKLIDADQNLKTYLGNLQRNVETYEAILAKTQSLADLDGGKFLTDAQRQERENAKQQLEALEVTKKEKLAGEQELQVQLDLADAKGEERRAQLHKQKVDEWVAKVKAGYEAVLMARAEFDAKVIDDIKELDIKRQAAHDKRLAAERHAEVEQHKYLHDEAIAAENALVMEELDADAKKRAAKKKLAQDEADFESGLYKKQAADLQQYVLTFDGGFSKAGETLAKYAMAVATSNKASETLAETAKMAAAQAAQGVLDGLAKIAEAKAAASALSAGEEFAAVLGGNVAKLPAALQYSAVAAGWLTLAGALGGAGSALVSMAQPPGGSGSSSRNESSALPTSGSSSGKSGSAAPPTVIIQTGTVLSTSAELNQQVGLALDRYNRRR